MALKRSQVCHCSSGTSASIASNSLKKPGVASEKVLGAGTSSAAKNAVQLKLGVLASASASALSLSGQAGEHYTNLAAGFGTETSGLALSGNWTHSDDDGDAAGLGLGLNLPLGPLLATVGGKGIYTNPNDGDEGYAAAVGGGLQWPIGDSFRLFGE